MQLVMGIETRQDEHDQEIQGCQSRSVLELVGEMWDQGVAYSVRNQDQHRSRNRKEGANEDQTEQQSRGRSAGSGMHFVDSSHTSTGNLIKILHLEEKLETLCQEDQRSIWRV